MPSIGDWKIPAAAQPRPTDYAFDLQRTLQSVVGLRAIMPADAFTADTLGTERAGHGVIIGDRGLILTVGYLITEAEQVWLHLADGRAVPATPIGFDQATGFGLVQALSRIDEPPLPFGSSAAVTLGDPLVDGGARAIKRSVAAQVVGKQEYAGYWEYVLDEAIFTAPSHPHWGGTALIGARGELLGVGSLQLEANSGRDINMMIPIDLLKPVLDDMLAFGSRRGPVRPWLGMYVADTEERMVVMGLASRGPAQRARIETGDIVVAVNGERVESLADLFRKIWAMGDAGTNVPLTLVRGERSIDVVVQSADRSAFLKRPRAH